MLNQGQRAGKAMLMLAAVKAMFGIAQAGGAVREPRPSRRNAWRAHQARQEAKKEYSDKVLGKAFRQYRKRYAGY